MLAAVMSPFGQETSAPSGHTTGEPEAHRLPDLGDLKALRLDLGEQPLDLRRVDDAGPEMLCRLGPAGDAVAQAFER
jgi:hypothetical protein